MSESGMNNAFAQNMIAGGLPMAGSPGMRLAAYRQERGWTVEQVASQLNLAPRQVMAIENDDYPSLPGMPIVRGFIRSYAKLLKVDAAPLLVSLGGETTMAHETIAPRRTLSTPFSETRLPSMTDRSGFLSKWVLVLLLVLLCGVAIWAAQQNSDVSNLQKSAASQVKNGLAYLSGSNQTETVQNPALVKEDSSVVAERVETVPNTSAVEQIAIAPTPAVPTPGPASSAEKLVPAVSPSDTASPSEVVTVSGKDTLVLKAREDSWIQIKRTDNNKVLFARLVKAGTVETVEIVAPVSLVVGNATGVEATLRGTPVELKSLGGNVSRLNLN